MLRFIPHTRLLLQDGWFHLMQRTQSRRSSKNEETKESVPNENYVDMGLDPASLSFTDNTHFGGEIAEATERTFQ